MFGVLSRIVGVKVFTTANITSLAIRNHSLTRPAFSVNSVERTRVTGVTRLKCILEDVDQPIVFT